MKNLFILLTTVFIFSTHSYAAENWKGHTEASQFEFGVMSGLSSYGMSSAWGLLANGAYLIKPTGWIDDIDDRVWLEGQAGPAFFSGSAGTGFQYSAHLRWDFTMNEYWTFYSLGGLAGYVLPSTMATGSSFLVHPRFGAGVEYQTKTALMFRGEVSAEFTGVGIALNF